MDWVDRPQNYKGLYGILQLLQGSDMDNPSVGRAGGREFESQPDQHSGS